MYRKQFARPIEKARVGFKPKRRFLLAKDSRRAEPCRSQPRRAQTAHNDMPSTHPHLPPPPPRLIMPRCTIRLKCRTALQSQHNRSCDSFS
jgi:hypothetical protein